MKFVYKKFVDKELLNFGITILFDKEVYIAIMIDFWHTSYVIGVDK